MLALMKWREILLKAMCLISGRHVELVVMDVEVLQIDCENPERSDEISTAL
jgi:hypothetical protein